jgi:hypothetical protein
VVIRALVGAFGRETGGTLPDTALSLETAFRIATLAGHFTCGCEASRALYTVYRLTIAACHVSPEGVVLGADSATTITRGRDGVCHLDYAQKVFEVGSPRSSIGLVTWGLGQIGADSHRTIAAECGDAHETKPFPSMQALAQHLADDVWGRYKAAYSEDISRFGEILRKAGDGVATPEEIEEAKRLLDVGACGYCLAGRVGRRGRCEAIEILWGVDGPPKVRKLDEEAPCFWGVPQIMLRLLYGIDHDTIRAILESGKWQGTMDELAAIAAGRPLVWPRLLPIREAIDWVHTVIHTTIRGTKFASWPHFCGGPVEIAAITTDRPFRWVRHKRLDAAILSEAHHGEQH